MSNDILEKGRSFPIGTIHNGFKKVAEGKWRKVSEHGMTKEEHEKEEKKHTKDSEILRERSLRAKKSNESAGLFHQGTEKKEEAKKHRDASSKLDSKDYSDTEVLGKFGSEVSYSLNDWAKWKNEMKNVGVIKIVAQDGLDLVYHNNNHIATYNTKEKTLFTDHEKIFGHEVNKSITNDIQKALTTLEIGYLSGEVDEQTIISARMSAEELEKGVKLELGHISTRKDGSKWRKIAGGWEPVKEGGKSSTNAKKEITDAPVGSKASGGGYGDWEKIGNNSWKNSKSGALSHDEGLFSRIGGFDDFKVKSKATDQPNMSEKVQSKVFGEGEKKPNKELLGEHSITKNGEKGSVKVGWSEIGEHYTYSGNLGKASISGNNVSEEKIKELLGEKDKKGDFEVGKKYTHTNLKGVQNDFRFKGMIGNDYHFEVKEKDGTWQNQIISPKMMEEENGKFKETIYSKGKESKEDNFPTKEDIISKLVSAGNNSEDAKKMVEEHYDYIKRVHPSSGLKKLAEVIRTIY